ncbi:FMN-binding protein [Candidatus Woesebacteria bacterium]|nr:FMN-binding protein [Candidatus Woesebacteria bacterium]
MDLTTIKKIGLSALVVFIFLVYAVHDRIDGREETNRVVISTESLIPSPFATSQPASKYKDGTYTGPVTDAYYGDVQVQVAVQGGKISDVTFLKYPNDRRTAIEINQQAMPFLKQEAINAQSTNIDIVSGATQTSMAFIESLKSALDQAI